MSLFPEMSTSVNTKPPGRDWMSKDDVKDFEGNHILCLVSSVGKHEGNVDRCRVYFHPLSSPYFTKPQNERLRYLKTSVVFEKSVLVDLVKQWGLVGKTVPEALANYEMFVQFCMADGLIATKSLTRVARRESA